MGGFPSCPRKPPPPPVYGHIYFPHLFDLQIKLRVILNKMRQALVQSFLIRYKNRGKLLEWNGMKCNGILIVCSILLRY